MDGSRPPGRRSPGRRILGGCVIAFGLVAAARTFHGTQTRPSGLTPSASREIAADSQLPRLTAIDVERFADSMFAGYMREFPEPSLAVVVVQGDSTLLSKGYGKESSRPARLVDPDSTLFNIASVSKLFTVTAAMQLVDRGALSLDGDITRWLGSEVVRGDGPTITLRHLLTHTSGLDGAFMRDVVANPSDLIALKDYFVRFPPTRGRLPGQEIRYSNVGMALAGRLVELGSGMPFDDYVERHVLQPLQMHRSTFRQPPAQPLKSRIATHGSGSVPDVLLLSPAGAMVSTASDMGRFMRAHLSDGTLGGVRILAPARARQMRQTQWRPSDVTPGVGLGFFASDLGGVPGVFHTGARVHFSLMYLVPEHGLGIFVVHAMRQGGPHQTLRTDFARALIERYIQPDPLEPASLATQRSWPPSTQYAGVYRPVLLATTTIERAAQLATDTPVEAAPDGSLTVRVPGGTRLDLQRVGRSHYRVRGGSNDGLHVAFTRGDDGRVRGFAMSGSTQDPVSFERLRWFERGVFHSLLIGAILILFVSTALAALFASLVRRIFRRRGAVDDSTPEAKWAWRLVIITGSLVLLSPLSTFLIVATHQGDDTAAGGLRFALSVGLTFLLLGTVTGLTLPPLAVTAWRRRYWGIARLTYFTLLATGVLVALPLLYHYHLLGYWF